MEIYTLKDARDSFQKIVKDCQQSSEPTWILGKGYKAVILSEELYESMQESIEVFSTMFREERQRQKETGDEGEIVDLDNM